jgi:hypothetical protein
MHSAAEGHETACREPYWFVVAEFEGTGTSVASKAGKNCVTNGTTGLASSPREFLPTDTHAVAVGQEIADGLLWSSLGPSGPATETTFHAVAFQDHARLDRP